MNDAVQSLKEMGSLYLLLFTGAALGYVVVTALSGQLI